MNELSDWIVIANTAGAIVVVVLFLRHLQQLNASQEVIEAKRQEALKHIGNDCHQHSERVVATLESALSMSQETIRENSKVLGRVTEVLAEFDRNVDKLARALETK